MRMQKDSSAGSLIQQMCRTGKHQAEMPQLYFNVKGAGLTTLPVAIHHVMVDRKGCLCHLCLLLHPSLCVFRKIMGTTCAPPSLRTPYTLPLIISSTGQCSVTLTSDSSNHRSTRVLATFHQCGAMGSLSDIVSSASQAWWHCSQTTVQASKHNQTGGSRKVTSSPAQPSKSHGDHNSQLQSLPARIHVLQEEHSDHMIHKETGIVLSVVRHTLNLNILCTWLGVRSVQSSCLRRVQVYLVYFRLLQQEEQQTDWSYPCLVCWLGQWARNAGLHKLSLLPSNSWSVLAEFTH